MASVEKHSHRDGKSFQFLMEPDRLWVLFGAKPLLCYVFNPERARPFCHPLYTLKGEVVTLDAPYDHLHHTGLYMAHPEVNGCNFWVDPDLPYGPPEKGRILHEAFEKLACSTTSAEWTECCLWQNHLGSPILHEMRKVKVQVALEFEAWHMDWTFHWKAISETVTFGSQTPYHGLSYRCARSMNLGTIVNSEGKEGPKECDGSSARWCAYTGRLNGRQGEATIVMMDHPKNPRYPTPFFCMNEPFGFLAAAFSRNEPFVISADNSENPVTFRYRIIVAQGGLDRNLVERLFDEFSELA
ncbi:MAG: PmoA family protein [Armatimonadetes bacterium]|nr:PmoA family protein [Armatimonadota bacterium]MDW8028900.1 PmoA family protein [Armatimonadota bacterium]